MNETRTSLDRLARVIGLLILIAGASRGMQAQTGLTWPPLEVSRLAVSADYSFVRANAANSGGSFNLNGGSASVTYDLSDRFAAVANFGGYRFGDLPAGLGSTMYSYLLGPRVSMHKWEQITPFAQVLLGVGRLNAGSGSLNAGENGFAMALGGGLDLRVRSHFAVRAIQAEYLMTRFPLVTGESATQNNIRISAGIVYRFRAQ